MVSEFSFTYSMSMRAKVEAQRMKFKVCGLQWNVQATFCEILLSLGNQPKKSGSPRSISIYRLNTENRSSEYAYIRSVTLLSEQQALREPN